MVLGFVRRTIAQLINIENPKSIELDYSFIDEACMDEDKFFELLEILEEEMEVNLLDVAWKFENLKQLVDYINNKK